MSITQVIERLNNYTQSWWSYYGLAESTKYFNRFENWLRRRLRALIWEQWKNYRTRIKELKKRGIDHETAVTVGCSRKGPWRMSKTHWVHIALPNGYFEILGLRYPWISSA